MRSPKVLTITLLSLCALSCQRRADTSEEPPLCGWSVDYQSVESSWLDNTLQARAACLPTIPGKNATADYTDYLLTKGPYGGSIVRVIQEQYSGWGEAHKALGKRIEYA